MLRCNHMIQEMIKYTKNSKDNMVIELVQKSDRKKPFVYAAPYTYDWIINKKQTPSYKRFIIKNLPSIIKKWLAYKLDLYKFRYSAPFIQDLSELYPNISKNVSGPFYINCVKFTDTDTSKLISIISFKNEQDRNLISVLFG